MATLLHPAGHNVLPRDNPRWAELIAHYQRNQPAISVSFLERSGIDRLREVSPHTLYIYRHAVSGKDNDDDVQDTFENAAGFVDYLNSLAPTGAALYLGNEPKGNWGKLAVWTIAALNRCDQLGRVGVALNLSYGNPEPEVWRGELKPVLDRLANTKHILGLHEYWTPGTLGNGYWTNRWVGNIPYSVKVAITELGALGWNEDRTDLNARKGWRLLPNYPANKYAAEIRVVIDAYLKQPNFIGACIFSAGNWHGCETGKDLYDELEAYKVGVTMPETTPPLPAGYGTKLVNGTMTLMNATAVNFRKLPSASAAVAGTSFKGGESVNYWSQSSAGWWKVERGGVIGYVSAEYAKPVDGVVDDVDPFPPVTIPLPELDLSENERRNSAIALRWLADLVETGVIKTS